MPLHPLIKRFYSESNLLGHSFSDGTLTFYSAVNSFILKDPGEKVVLNLGCGTGSLRDEFNKKEEVYTAYLQNFKGRVKKVIGLDVDPNAAINPSIDEFHLIEVDKPWPIPDASVDVCVADWVLEHVANPPFFFSELNRIMKKDGYVCLRTTNKFGYNAVFSMLIPNKFHGKIIEKVQPLRKEEDVFPTVYKCNTKASLVNTFKQNGFEPFVYHNVAEPHYFTFSYVSFAFGYYLHKILPDFLKPTLFAFGRKK